MNQFDIQLSEYISDHLDSIVENYKGDIIDELRQKGYLIFPPVVKSALEEQKIVP